MNKSLQVILLACIALLGAAGQVPAFEGPPVAEIVKKVRKSVIRIQGISVHSPAASGGHGGGSGVVYQINYDDGTAYALTNHHVSGDSMINSVRFWDGAEYKAELVATEPGIDTALLKLYGLPDERGLPDSEKTIVAAPLGDSQKMQIGDFAIAMGAPGAGEGINASRDDPWQNFMLQQTVTSGVITGKHSVIEFPLSIWQQNRNGLGQQYGTNFDYAFRITVAINGGNSGGPLFNDSGEVIGLNFYGGSWSLGQNTNHAIPIHLAKDFAFQVLNTGRFEKPWLGLDMLFPPSLKVVGDINEMRAKQVSIGRALEIFDVRNGSAAERAGFKPGDVMLAINGRKFNTPEEVRVFVFAQPIGTTLAVEVARNGSKLKNPIMVEVQPKRAYDSEFSI